MTQTINATCTNIVITSETNPTLFQQWLDYIPEEQVSLQLEVYTSCSTTPIKTLTVHETDSTGDLIVLQTDGGQHLDIVPADLNSEYTVFPDGPIYFKLIYKELDNGTVKEETGCVFSSCELKCKVSEFTMKNPQCTEAQLIYNALVNSNDCQDCSCTNACFLYNKLKEILDTQTTSDDSCGCSASSQVLAIY